MTQDASTLAVLPAAEDAAPKPAKPGPLKKAAQLLVGMAIGAVIGFVGMSLAIPEIAPETRALLRDRLGAWDAPFLVAVALLMAYVGVVVHELGHVLGGVAARFRFHLYVAGPLRIERDEATGRLSVGFNRVVSLAGGIVAMLPTDTHDLRRRFALVIAGGPLASFALALAAWAPLALDASLPPLADIVLGITALMSAGLGIVSIIPMNGGGFTSDGGRLLRLVRGGPVAERESAMLPLITLSMAETPPREWPRELVEGVVALRDASSDECIANLMAYSHALDTGDVELAARRMGRTLETLEAVPPGVAPSIRLEAAFFAAFRRDAAGAREHLAAVPEKAFGIKPYDRDRAAAALAAAEGDLARARELAERALAGLPANAAFRRETLRAAMAAAEAPVEAAV
jgi:hypothetical protein